MEGAAKLAKHKGHDDEGGSAKPDRLGPVCYVSVRIQGCGSAAKGLHGLQPVTKVLLYGTAGDKGAAL